MHTKTIRHERAALTVMHYSAETRTREAARLESFAKPSRCTRRPRRSMYADGILQMLATVRAAAAFVGL